MDHDSNSSGHTNKKLTPVRMIQSIDAEALIKQAAEYFRLGESELTRKRGSAGTSARIDTVGLSGG
jgi:hypothetical protein